RHRTIFDSTIDSLLVFDTEGRIVEANPAACRMYEYAREELLGLSGMDIVHPDCHHKFEDFKHQARTTGEFYTESVDVRKDGSTFEVEVHGTTFNFNGKTHLLAVIRDITQQKKDSAEMTKLSAAVNQSANMICITDADWIIEYVNPQFSEVTGFGLLEVIGESLSTLIAERDNEEFFRVIRDTVQSGKTWSGRVQCVRKNGEIYWERQTISAIHDTNGRITNYLAVKEDITAELTTREKLIESDKLVAVGTLAAGVSHEFKN
ncbi:unnamed protein product, partial [marine sediment metagenome]